MSQAGRAELRSLEEILEAAVQIRDDVVADEVDRIEAEHRWPEKSFEALKASGLTGLVVPREHGGLGQGLTALTKVCEVLGQASGSVAISYGMHNVGTAVVAAKATPAQVETYLEPIARGEHITTLALSEPGTGSHFYYPETEIRHDEAGYVVDGFKTFATNGAHADSYVVSTRAADPDAPPGLFSCVMVREGAEGLGWGPPYAGWGMRGNSARSFELAGVHVPREDLLGAEGDQIWYVFHVVAPYFLVSMAGTYLGIAERALHETIDHLKQRRYSHTGQTLGREPVLQHRLGELWARVERTRRLVYWAAEEAERGGPDALPALCSAKAEIADCVVGVVNDAMTVMGGKTYRDSAVLPRLLRDARAADVMAPTTDVLRTWTGRALLDIPILGE